MNTTYFQYREVVYKQKLGCAIGAPVSTIAANLYMPEKEHRALSSFSGTVPSHWLRYVDDTWVKTQKELDAFSAHFKKTDKYVRFTRQDVKESSPAFLDCAVKIEDRNLTLRFTKNQHTDQYFSLDSHHPLEHKLGVIKHYNKGPKKYPQPRRQRRNRNTSKQH